LNTQFHSIRTFSTNIEPTSTKSTTPSISQETTSQTQIQNQAQTNTMSNNHTQIPINDSSSPSSSSSTSSDSSVSTHERTWWQQWTGPRQMPPKYTMKWYLEMLLICTVFAITGSSSMFLVRPSIKEIFQIDGTLIDGPWSYRILCIVILMPAYSCLLLTFGTLAGRYSYFKPFVIRMWSRFIPKRFKNTNISNQTKQH
jgi:hypothetical protein